MADSQRTGHAHNFKDISGGRFGLLTAIEFIRRTEGDTIWRCRCDCGVIVEKRGNHLRSGATTRCCFQKHHQKKGKRPPLSPERMTWQSIKQRCRNPNDPYFALYGGRGIEMCDRWFHSFELFLEDMGPRPSDCTIDRIDNDGNYEPANCRWATRKEQGNNRRTNRFIEFNGEVKTVSQWAEQLGVKPGCLRARLGELNWSVEKALTTPIDAVKSKSGSRRHREDFQSPPCSVVVANSPS